MVNKGEDAMSGKYSDEQIERGLNSIEQIYGRATRDLSASKLPAPQTQETLGNLMGDIWQRPGLSIRDRRLLVLGVTAMLNDETLIKVIVGGALQNGELNDEQLDEIILHLSFYIGWGKSGALTRGIAAARAAHEASKEGAA
jgi:4-carboxymuconolactone decarboxylase